MMRILHRWLGLVLTVLLLVTALSGAALSLFPALMESARTVQPEATLTVGRSGRAGASGAPGSGTDQARALGTDQRMVVRWRPAGLGGDQPGHGPRRGQRRSGLTAALAHQPAPLALLGDGGRWMVATGALAMLLLALSGAVLVARRTGGWRRWFTRLRGPLLGRLHTDIARVAVLGLVLSSVTALWMAAETLELVTIDTASLETPPRSAAKPAWR